MFNYLKFKSVKLFLSCVYGCLRDNHNHNHELLGNPFVSSVCVTAKLASFVIFRLNRRLQFHWSVIFFDNKSWSWSCDYWCSRGNCWTSNWYVIIWWLADEKRRREATTEPVVTVKMNYFFLRFQNKPYFSPNSAVVLVLEFRSIAKSLESFISSQ